MLSLQDELLTYILYKMKKILLLSGVACLMAANAEAGYYNWQKISVRPYIGGEYVYSHAHMGSDAKNFKKNFHSGKADFGMEWDKNIYTEFSFQMSGDVRNSNPYGDGKTTTHFQAYALDLYGKMPIMCSSLGALLTAGGAIYDVKYKQMVSSSNKKVGYRAGVGLQYDITDHISARVIGRYSYLGTKRINNFKEVAVGMLYRF